MKTPLLTLQLHRSDGTDQGTPGVLSHLGQKVCYMMELPDRDNRPNLGRIPPGRYLVRYLPRSASGKYRDVYHVTNVPDRAGILSHPGNVAGDKLKGYRTDSWGCLLPALRLGRLYGQVAGLASRAALRRIHEITQRNDFYLEVY
ncbi:DUF5675 family protein [Thiomicrorhabdus cannonii]|uniref:DUF5675 family protein n=1 Tax=Thiomicrorhabdus cannonii TaxID=2748011 RepID=UPI001FE6E36D|nr:DUF5675 family protein [Thiomicrorhabdus cannonii]